MALRLASSSGNLLQVILQPRGKAWMLGQKEKQFTARVVSLEQLVPPDNFYRQPEANLDLSFVYDLVKGCYASAMGRPSICSLKAFAPSGN